jgi:hypothetical protein
MGGPAKIDGELHEECDNFLICSFEVDGITYPSAEHYFQCMKTTNKNDHDKIKLASTAMKSWTLGNEVKLRSDWEEVKVNIMYEGNLAKFTQNEELMKSLCSSLGKVDFGGSTPFWNYWNGLIMERIRAEIRGTEEDNKVAEEIRILMDQYSLEKKK